MTPEESSALTEVPGRQGEPSEPDTRPKPWLRLGSFVLFILLVLGVGYRLGLRERFEAEALRATIDAAGGWGFLLFVAAFLLGQVLYIPGMVFVGVAVFAWGPFVGFVISYGCGLLAVNAHFALLRLISGKPLAAGAPGKRWRLLQRALDDLESHPIRSVILLRLLAFMSPPLNTALALTGLKTRDHLIGSAIGLLLPIAAATGLFDFLFSV